MKKLVIALVLFAAVPAQAENCDNVYGIFQPGCPQRLEHYGTEPTIEVFDSQGAVFTRPNPVCADSLIPISPVVTDDPFSWDAPLPFAQYYESEYCGTIIEEYDLESCINHYRACRQGLER